MIVVVALVVLCGASFYVYKTNDVNETYENKETKNNSNMLSMMLETSAGSGEYQQTTASVWPTEGYTFNENLSKCEKGSSLSWDSTKNTVVMMGNVSDKCYVYFDVYVPPRYDEICDESLLACHVAKQYTGIQGENNMYYHNSTLTNGAGDGSYRYAGSSETTNNFVCFGYDSTDGSCPTDYLYRIIGVFDGEVKLIKYDYGTTTELGTDGDYYKTYKEWGMDSMYYKGTYGDGEKIGVYYWNYSNGSSSTNTWSASRLNTTNLNTNYLNNIGTNWSNKIANHTWKVGKNTYSNIYSATTPNAYKNEITSPAENTTYEAKIGLMYVSDYGYAASQSAWTTTLGFYNNSSVKSVNWMYMGLFEWTLACRSDNSSYAFFVPPAGHVDSRKVYYGIAVRPVLYLASETAYAGGSGTASSPILLS